MANGIKIHRTGEIITSYSTYLKSNHWFHFKQEYYYHFYKVCKCGNPAVDLHHLTYENLGNEKFEDVTPLCKRCHLKEHPEVGQTATPLLKLRRKNPHPTKIKKVKRLSSEEKYIRGQAQEALRVRVTSHWDPKKRSEFYRLCGGLSTDRPQGDIFGILNNKYKRLNNTDSDIPEEYIDLVIEYKLW